MKEKRLCTWAPLTFTVPSIRIEIQSPSDCFPRALHSPPEYRTHKSVIVVVGATALFRSTLIQAEVEVGIGGTYPYQDKATVKMMYFSGNGSPLFLLPSGRPLNIIISIKNLSECLPVYFSPPLCVMVSRIQSKGSHFQWAGKRLLLL